MSGFILCYASCQLGGHSSAMIFKGPRVEWYQPTSLKQLTVLRDRFPHAAEKGKPQCRLLVGNTEIGKWSVDALCLKLALVFLLLRC